eukprot:m.14184 g.14184  ORF g.14184 m.14184 type:complete len:325 (-) comp4746_c0_seq2:117-1091(-)
MDLEMLLAVVLGGACGLVLVALVIVLCIRRRRRKDRDQEHRHRKHKAGDVETALMSQPPDVLANKKVTNPLYQRQNSFAEPSGPLDSRPVSQATLVVATDSSALVVTQTIESTADETFGFLIPAPEEAEHGAGSGAGSGAGNSRPTSAASSSAAPAATTTATTSGAGAAAGAAGSTPATTTTAAATPAVSEPPSPTKSVDSAKTPRGSMKHLYMEVLTKAGSPQPGKQERRLFVSNYCASWSLPWGGLSTSFVCFCWPVFVLPQPHHSPTQPQLLRQSQKRRPSRLQSRKQTRKKQEQTGWPPSAQHENARNKTSGKCWCKPYR